MAVFAPPLAPAPPPPVPFPPPPPTLPPGPPEGLAKGRRGT